MRGLSVSWPDFATARRMAAASLMYCCAISLLNRVVFVPAKVNLRSVLFSITAFTNDACCCGDRSVPLSSAPDVEYGCLVFQELKLEAMPSKVLSETVTAQNNEPVRCPRKTAGIINENLHLAAALSLKRGNVIRFGQALTFLAYLIAEAIFPMLSYSLYIRWVPQTSGLRLGLSSSALPILRLQPIQSAAFNFSLDT
jgi:hypothetical protein